MKKIKRSRIKNIKVKENEDVYDLSVKDNHNFFANNILVHNCGEIVLGPYGTCRLGSINLLGFVKNLYDENTDFDWSKFDKYSRRAQRFMDDIIDLEEEKINKILAKIDKDEEPKHIKRNEREIWEKVLETLKKGRRTGLGILGLGDTLAALNYEYGTSEGTEFTEKLTKRLAINSYKESILLAKERNAFPICDVNKESNNPFLSRVIGSNLSKDEYNNYVKYGRRNIANLAIAPTGCINENTVIQTDRGNLNIKDIFFLNDIDIEDLRGLKDIWIEPKFNIYVNDINGNKQKIKRLYWNGKSNGYKFKFKDNFKVKTSSTHKFLVYIGNNKAIWKKASEIKKGDNIVKKIKDNYE